MKQESYFKWIPSAEHDPVPTSGYEYEEGGYSDEEQFAAFTVAELSELLPPYWMLLKNIDYFRLLWWQESPEKEYQRTLMIRKSDHELHADTPADCMAKMLIYLVENGSHSTELCGEVCHHSSKASRGEDLEVEHPV